MLVIERFRCCMCGRETRHATYPLFERRECLCCNLVSVVPELFRLVERIPLVRLDRLRSFYAGIPRTP